MTVILCIITGVSVLMALVTVVVFLWQRHKLRQTTAGLMNMLDMAIDGTFKEHIYDESLFSAVESKMNDYLLASEVSTYNLATEKDKIKELISDISHQTKTPIANLLLYAQLLEEQELPPQSHVYVQTLHNQAEKLSFLIASLLKLSRLETGILVMHPQTSNVLPLLQEVHAQFAPIAQRSEVTFTFESTDAKAMFNPKWTVEALANLVDNAIKYTPAKGSVHIKVTSYELFCRIDVRDTGMGISEDEQPKIFARFYRSPSIADSDGVGIGLYLARQIITQQGGYIKVTSSTGKGSIFSIFLPQITQFLQN